RRPRVRLPALGVALVAGMLAVAGSRKADVVAAPNCPLPNDRPPADLARTGLYADWQTKTVAPAERVFAPAVPFWSDGYDKTRLIELPDGVPIDATAVDDWTFPVGTKVWKEFRHKERKIETRLFWKVAADRWARAAY